MQMFVVSIPLGKDKMIAALVEDQQQLPTRAFLASIRSEVDLTNETTWPKRHPNDKGKACGELSRMSLS
jgi:hypothetical protein